VSEITARQWAPRVWDRNDENGELWPPRASIRRAHSFTHPKKEKGEARKLPPKLAETDF